MSSICKGCGKTIYWGVTVDGKKIPLDPEPPIYSVQGQLSDNPIFVERESAAMVSHLSICSAANNFSRNKRGGQEA